MQPVSAVSTMQWEFRQDNGRLFIESLSKSIDAEFDWIWKTTSCRTNCELTGIGFMDEPDSG